MCDDGSKSSVSLEKLGRFAAKDFRTNLSDEARSILVFAAYHELTSGEPVKEVVLDDGVGHKASTKGQEELSEAGLIRIDSNRAQIAEEGEQALAEILNAIRQATGS